MNRDCQQSERSIQLLLDGRLSLSERARLDCHVAECAECASLLDNYRSVTKSVEMWTRPGAGDDPGDAFNAAILARVAALPARRGMERSSIAAAVATCVACVVAGFLVVPRLGISATTGTLSNYANPSAFGIGILSAPASFFHDMASGHLLPIVQPSAWVAATAACAVLINLWFVRRTRSSAELAR